MSVNLSNLVSPDNSSIEIAAEEEEELFDSVQNSRQICPNGCDRPVSVCLCSVIPTTPISTFTKLIILHHPHEARHKLATVPVLTKCLNNCHIITGRRLHPGSSPLLDCLHNNPDQPHHAIFLFPGTPSSPSMDLTQWASSNLDNIDNLVLIVFDGTWKHAKEMMTASLPFLSKFATQVCLSYDVGAEGESIFNSELVLRKEPFGGCMSTIEAVARSLKVLESNGSEIEDKLIPVLREMVRFQACYLKDVKVRPKLSKKGKQEKQKNHI